MSAQIEMFPSSPRQPDEPERRQRRYWNSTYETILRLRRAGYRVYRQGRQHNVAGIGIVDDVMLKKILRGGK